MTCPLFEKAALDRFMAVYDPDLKGWGADWWFLQVRPPSRPSPARPFKKKKKKRREPACRMHAG